MRHADRIEPVLDELYDWWAPSDDPVLDALRAAIFVEDAFGITLTEDELDAAHLGDRDALRATLATRMVT